MHVRIHGLLHDVFRAAVCEGSGLHAMRLISACGAAESGIGFIYQFVSVCVKIFYILGPLMWPLVFICRCRMIRGFLPYNLSIYYFPLLFLPYFCSSFLAKP